MKSATVRQIRHDFGSVLAMVQEGEIVEVKKYGKVVAVINSPPPKRSKKRPDFLARFEKMHGKEWETRVPKVNAVVRDRESREY
jgi:antitoxin (DNA-binding transcriptional repressor) of toxin-antitoxin stability system